MNYLTFSSFKKELFLAGLFFIVGINSYSQSCPTQNKNAWQWPTHSNWYFGDGNMLNFPGGTGNPVITNVAPAGYVSPAVTAYEGTTVISDDAGNLKYYCNGRLMWDAAGVLKSNGFLTGNEKNGSRGNPGGSTGSATQGIISVRHPLNPDMVYIFTTDDAITDNTSYGFNYWTLNTKTGQLTFKKKLINRCTEQIDATLHSNGVDVWIVTRVSGKANKNDFRNFHAYLLTCTGLNETPVVSVAGPTIEGTYTENWERGGLKISWDGKKVVAVNHLVASEDFGDAMTSYDFDNATGILSNVQSFAGVWGQWSWNGPTYYSAYDVEFAPNSQAVMVSMVGSELFWFDISSNNGATIYASKKDISTSIGGSCALQMGGNGKLYMANVNGNSIYEISGNFDTGTGFSNKTIAAPNPGQRGLPSFFLPPADEPDIQEVGPFCNDIAPVDLNTLWLCKGTNAESTTAPASTYTGKGITDAAKGIFDPKVAGEGTHEIIFTKCSVDDTIWIVVNKCSDVCPDTTLKSIAPICVGSTVDLNAHKITTENGTWSIQGSGANYPTLAGNTFTTTSTTAAGSYVVRYTLSPAPSDPLCPAFAERTIKVNAIPAVTFSTTDVCEGSGVITFNGSPAGGTYTGTGITGATFDPTSPSSIAVTYTYTTNGCSNTVTSTQVVNAKPTLTFTTTPVCEGAGMITFNGNPTGGIYSGAGVSGATFNPSTASTTAITYSYTDTKGCSNSITTNQVVNAKPTVTFTTTPVCEGSGNVTFNGNPAGGTYSGTGISGATFTPSTAGTTAINYTYTDVNGCVDSAKANQVVNKKPILSLPDQTICPGGSTELDAGIGDGNLSYSWAPNGETTQKITVNSANTYTATVTNASGCSASDAIVVTVNANLNIDLGLDQSICEGESKTFTTNYAGTGVMYTWSGPNAYSNSSQAITVSDAGTYHVDVIDPLGCTGNDDVVLTVNTLPTPTLTDGEICERASHIFDAGVYDFYSWSSGETDQSISKSQAGNYTVTVTDGNGCTGSASANLIVNINPIVDLGNDYIDCEGTTVVFDAGNPGADYLWSNNSLSQSITVSSNGTYSVIVTDAKGCKGTAAVKATFVEVPELEIGDDIHLCEGESAQITAELNPASSELTWSTKENGLSITVSSPQVVIATANNGGGQCMAKDTLEVFVHKKPEPALIAEQTFCFLDSLTYATLDAGVNTQQYLWSTGDTTKIISVKKGGIYSVDLISEFKCSSSSKVTIHEKCESSLFVPNAFTPNEDGHNEIFYVEGTNIYDFELWIFDRWGEMIYHATDMSKGWNGKRDNILRDAQVDVYVWKIKYHFWEDVEKGKPLREKVGHVSIIR